MLVEHGVQPSVIILLSLFSTPHGECQGPGVSPAGDRDIITQDRQGRAVPVPRQQRFAHSRFGVGSEEGLNGRTANARGFLKAGVCSTAGPWLTVPGQLLLWTMEWGGLGPAPTQRDWSYRTGLAAGKRLKGI